MKNYKQILEAINKGIQLALDDEDDSQLSSKQNVIKNIDGKELWKIHNMFVDLGLPSGTLWAKYNLGVDPNKLSKPESWYGNYYAWGEIEPKNEYTQDNYKYHNNVRDRLLTKYCLKPEHGYVDNMDELLPEDDAAYNINHYWRIPTNEQFRELLEYTINKWTENYKNIKGLNGLIFKSKINGGKIFFPACGYSDIYVNYCANIGAYWASNIISRYSHAAYSLDFNNTGVTSLQYQSKQDSGSILRCFSRPVGLSIRPVLNR